jgi:hypothetical protein
LIVLKTQKRIEMNISGKAVVKNPLWLSIVLIVLSIGFNPLVANAQEEDGDNETEQFNNNSNAAPDPVGTLNTSPWGTNAGNASTATDTREAEGNVANPSQPNRGGTAARPRPGGTTLDGPDPGGNPDVPFDPLMNLGFLAVGLAFVVVVLRKKINAPTMATAK